MDTGGRRAEIAGLRYDPDDDAHNDIDLDQGVIRVMGKGRRQRVLPLGRKTVKALDRYILKVRAKHHAARESWLWLGKKGRLTATGIFHMIQRRGQQAGLGEIHPHQLRHTFAHTWLASGGNEGGRCVSPAGDRARCYSATRPVQRRSEHSPRTGGSVR